MPVRQIGPRQPTPAAQELLRRLVGEWEHPDPTATQPVIVEERDGPGQPVHVYVIWDDWADLPAAERSEIVLDAFSQRYGRDASLDVTVAMGLTPAEADRLGLPYRS